MRDDSILPRDFWNGWLTDTNDNDRYVEIEFTFDPGQPEQRQIFDKSGDLVDPGEPEFPSTVDYLAIIENGVDVSDQFDYDWDEVLLNRL